MTLQWRLLARLEIVRYTIPMSRKSNRSSQEYSFTVLYEPVRPKGYQVMVPLLPGLVTYGRTFDEARKMAREAIGCHLEAMEKEREIIPQETSILQERMTVLLQGSPEV